MSSDRRQAAALAYRSVVVRPPAPAHGGDQARLARCGEPARRGRLRRLDQPRLVRRPVRVRPLHVRQRPVHVLPRQGQPLRRSRSSVGSCASPGRSRSTATPRRGHRLPAAVEAVRAGKARGHLPRGHHHARPRPVADARQDRRGACRPRDALPADPGGPVGAQEILSPYGHRPRFFPRKTMMMYAGPPVDLSDLYGRPSTRWSFARRPTGSWTASPTCSRCSGTRSAPPSGSTRAPTVSPRSGTP